MADDPPGAPRLEFESMLTQLVARADEMKSSQERMRDLFRVAHVLTSNLDLAAVLRQIVETGAGLIGARYVAMGVIGTQGRRLEQFIHVGMDEATTRRIGHLPVGKGLLGALIDEPEPIRLQNLGNDPRSSGFPEHHPPMGSFLGVPIRVRDEIFGNLYFTDSVNGEFSADDESLAEALAATAGVAVTNARLFEDATFRERWARTLADLSRTLLSADGDDSMRLFLEEVRDLATAAFVAIVLADPTGEELGMPWAAGEAAKALESWHPSTDRSATGRAVRSGEPVRLSEQDAAEDFGSVLEPGSTMVVPFFTGDERGGALVAVRRRSDPPFADRDLEMAIALSGHIGVALERQQARATRRRMTLMEDRSRIARDLHDHVIQRLFATGLGLQATAATVDEVAADRITAHVREIDDAIAQIRQSIFALEQQRDGTTVGLRARVLETVEHVADQFTERPRVVFQGPVDLMADGDLMDDVTAVVNEGLANVVRHAAADHVEVRVSAVGGEVTVMVVDDGVGPGRSPRFSGLRNLQDRAVGRGGSFAVSAEPPRGTRLLWAVPT